MSGLEKLLQAATGLPEADLETLTRIATGMKVTMAPTGETNPLNIRPEDDAILTELISISQESGRYLPGGSRFREEPNQRSA